MYSSQFKIPPKKSLLYSRNYIPHKTPSHTNYYLWKEVYNDYLLDIYNIFASTVNQRYDTKVIWNDDDIFDKFCRFVFDCSSKYINKDLKDEVFGVYDSSDDE